MNLPFEDRIAEKSEFEGKSESEKIVLKILENEVFDPVWFEVLRKHPELQVDSDGKPVPLDRNHKLRHKLNSYRNTEVGICFAGTIIHGDTITCIAMDDKLVGLSATGQTVSSSLSLRTEGHILNDNTVTPPIAYNIGPSAYFVVKSHLSFSPKYEQVESAVSIHSLHICQRIALLGLDLCTEIITPESAAAAAKKAGGAKKGAPVEPLKPKRLLKYRLLIVDMFKSAEGVQIYYEKVHDIQFECPFDYLTYDHLYALHDYVKIGLSADGQLLSLVVSESPAVCRIYQLDKVREKIASKIVEEREEDLLNVDAKVSVTSQPGVGNVVLKTPVVIAQWKVANSSALDNIKHIVQDLVLLQEKLPADNNHAAADTLSAELDLFATLQPQSYSRVRIILSVKGSPFLIRMGLKLKPEDAGAQGNNKGGGKDNKPKDKSKGAVEVPQPPPIACDVFEDQRINLSSSPSSLSFFTDVDASEYVVVGQEDGVVNLWNIHQDLLIAPLGSHPAPISCISSIYNPSNRRVDIIVGAVDGTLTYYNNQLNNSNDLSLTSMLEGRPVLGLESTSFVNYRQDVFNDCVVKILPLPHSPDTDRYLTDATLVQYASGLQVLYSLPDFSIIGSINNTERINFANVEAVRISSANIPLHRFIPLPPEDPPAFPEEIPPVDNNGKGGRKKEEPPVEEVKIEMEEEVPPPTEPIVIPFTTASLSSIQNLRSSGGSLERYAELSSVFVNRLKGKISLLMHAFREDRFVLSWYDISKAIEQELEGYGEDQDRTMVEVLAMKETNYAFNKGTSRKGSRAGSTVKGSKLKDLQNLSNKSLKLTEERLEEHARLLDRNQRGYSSAASIRSARDQLASSSLRKLDPAEAVRADLLASKRIRERERSRNTLGKTLQTLASFV